jgi:hypothetical protein
LVPFQETLHVWLLVEWEQPHGVEEGTLGLNELQKRVEEIARIETYSLETVKTLLLEF